jgi:DNA-binding NarL/FixJ family response regulator
MSVDVVHYVVNNRRSFMRLTPEQKKIIRAVNRGLSQGKKLGEIAAELNVNQATLCQRITRWGFRIEKRVVPINKAAA